MLKPSSFSIILPQNSEVREIQSGDYYFAQSLATALTRLGDHKTKILGSSNWHKSNPDDIVLFLRGGKQPPAQKFGKLMLQWSISFRPLIKQNEHDYIDHFFIASSFLQKRIQKHLPAGKTSLMYQAFDKNIMFPEDISTKNHMVFVGTVRDKIKRPITSFALESGLPFQLFGNGWENTEYANNLVGSHVNNADLGKLYRDSALVLNDHLPRMNRNEMISNRVYDGLACGRAVLSDSTSGAPEELKPFIYEYHDADSFKEQAERALSETIDERKERIKFAHKMRELHSFDQRAKQICDQAEKLL